MKQKSYQESDDLSRQMEDLARWWNLPETRYNTAVIARAVERAWQEEKSKRNHHQQD